MKLSYAIQEIKRSNDNGFMNGLIVGILMMAWFTW